VETTATWTLRVSKRFSDRVCLTVAVRYDEIENPGHIAGENGTQTSALLDFNWKVFDVGR